MGSIIVTDSPVAIVPQSKAMTPRGRHLEPDSRFHLEEVPPVGLRYRFPNVHYVVGASDLTP